MWVKKRNLADKSFCCCCIDTSSTITMLVGPSRRTSPAFPLFILPLAFHDLPHLPGTAVLTERHRLKLIRLRVPLRANAVSRVQRAVLGVLARRVDVLVEVVLRDRSGRCQLASGLPSQKDGASDSLLGVFGRRQNSPVCIMLHATSPVHPHWCEAPRPRPSLPWKNYRQPDPSSKFPPSSPRRSGCSP